MNSVTNELCAEASFVEGTPPSHITGRACCKWHRVLEIVSRNGFGSRLDVLRNSFASCLKHWHSGLPYYVFLSSWEDAEIAKIRPPRLQPPRHPLHSSPCLAQNVHAHQTASIRQVLFHHARRVVENQIILCDFVTLRRNI